MPAHLTPRPTAGWDGRRGWPSTLGVAAVVLLLVGGLPLLELATTPDRSTSEPTRPTLPSSSPGAP